jgi:chaperonin GroES
MNQDKLSLRDRTPVVSDRRRFKQKPETDLVPADYRGPGMSLAGREALAEAAPKPEFAVNPIVTQQEVAAITQVIQDHKIRCPRGWLLVHKLPPGEKIGSIIMPDVLQRDVEFGIVLAVGAGEFKDGVEVPPEVKAGNHVMFPPFAGQDNKVLGADVLQMRQDEIVLIAGE